MCVTSKRFQKTEHRAQPEVDCHRYRHCGREGTGQGTNNTYTDGVPKTNGMNTASTFGVYHQAFFLSVVMQSMCAFVSFALHSLHRQRIQKTTGTQTTSRHNIFPEKIVSKRLIYNEPAANSWTPDASTTTEMEAVLFNFSWTLRAFGEAATSCRFPDALTRSSGSRGFLEV